MSDIGFPIVDSSVYNKIVNNNEFFIGFVKYPDNIFSFVGCIPNIELKPTGMRLVDIKYKYIEFMPLRLFSNEKDINQENKVHGLNVNSQDNRRVTATIDKIFEYSELLAGMDGQSSKYNTNFEKNFMKFMKGEI